jgi:hypothetical protein
VGIAGEEVFAPTASRVTAIHYESGLPSYGMNIRLLTPEGYEIVLAHLSGIAPGLRPGMEVGRGQLVGLMGASGDPEGEVHLHYEVRRPGPDVFGGQWTTTTALDPRQFYPSGYSSPSRPKTLGADLSDFLLAPAASGIPSLALPAKAGTISAPGAGPGGEEARGPTPAPEASKGITIASTPIGEVTVPQPGQLFTRFVVGAVAVIIILISLYALLSKSGAIDKAKQIADKAGTVAAVASGAGAAPAAAKVAAAAAIKKRRANA